MHTSCPLLRGRPNHHHLTGHTPLGTPQPCSSSACSPLLQRPCRLRCNVTAAPPVAQHPSQALQQPPGDVATLDYAEPSPRVSRYVKEEQQTYTKPSIRDSGTLRPGAEWYPAWMQYRRREDNYVFWQDQFLRCSLDIPFAEKRWTVFSTLWFIMMEARFYYMPASLRYLVYLGWRGIMQKVYEAHKAIVLWQCKLDAYLASRAMADFYAQRGQEPPPTTFSRAMCLRRLHWKNSLLGELLYAINVAKTGRIDYLPPVQKPLQRPSLFFLF